MPGFVDVSNMSDLERKRLCQQDEDDEPQDRKYGSRNRAQPASTRYLVDNVWAAACAAQRENGEYIKEPKYEITADQTSTRLVKRRNRDVMLDYLANPSRLQDVDVDMGRQVRNFLQKDITFRVLKDQMSEFDTAVNRCLAVSDYFDSHAHRYELAVVASLPATMSRTQRRQDVEQRLKFAQGGFVGQPGDKMSGRVEVLSSNYSQQYGIYWIRAITEKDQPVFFSLRDRQDPGTWLTIRGTVKAHRDNLTQLNRVKVL